MDVWYEAVIELSWLIRFAYDEELEAADLLMGWIEQREENG